ncbi:MAG: hypothetical protein ACO2O6_09685 [Candidatus Hydrothermia bacterium]|jgi:hypothetical protein
MKNYVILITLLILYISSATFKVFYESKKFNKEYIANLSSMESFLSKSYVGTIADSYHYLKQAYSVYKTFKPYDCFRPITGYLFAPFLFVFKEYSILAILFFNATAFSIVLYLFLNAFNTSFKLKLFVITFVFLMTFYFVPRIMLEPYTMILTLLAILFYRNNKFFLSLILLFFASLIRNEFILVFIVFLFFILLKSKKILFVSTPLLIILLITNAILSGCEDQSNFYWWAIKNYYENVKHIEYEKAKQLWKEKCEILDDKCYKNILKSLFYEERDIAIKEAIKNIILNPIKLLIFPLDKYKWNFVYIIVNIIWFVLVIFSIIKSFEKQKVFIISLFLLVILYSLYAVFGGLDASRFKLYILPFEMAIILNYENRSF